MPVEGVGVFGGKFLPLHLGHVYAILSAARMCRELHLFLFYNTPGENEKISDSLFPKYLLFPSVREDILKNEFKECKNIKIHSVDFEVAFDPSSDSSSESNFWDYSSNAVREMISCEPGIIFSSEEDDVKHFKIAYPSSRVVLLDPARDIMHISGTMIRQYGAMKYWDYLPLTNRILSSRMVVLISDNEVFLESLLRDLARVFVTTTVNCCVLEEGKLAEGILGARLGANRVFFIGSSLSFFQENNMFFYKDSVIFKIAMDAKIDDCYVQVVDIKEETEAFSILVREIQQYRNE